MPRLCGILLILVLKLGLVDEIQGLLGLVGCLEYGPVVVLKDLNPRLDIVRVLAVVGHPHMCAKERPSKLRYQFFESVLGGAERVLNFAIKPGVMACPVGEFVEGYGIEALLILEQFTRRKGNNVRPGCVAGPVNVLELDNRSGLLDDLLGFLDDGDFVPLGWLVELLPDLLKAFRLVQVEDEIEAKKADNPRFLVPLGVLLGGLDGFEEDNRGCLGPLLHPTPQLLDLVIGKPAIKGVFLVLLLHLQDDRVHTPITLAGGTV